MSAGAAEFEVRTYRVTKDVPALGIRRGEVISADDEGVVMVFRTLEGISPAMIPLLGDRVRLMGTGPASAEAKERHQAADGIRSSRAPHLSVIDGGAR